jgi:transcriptional regulator with XRE-family HTH domain
MNDKIPKLFGQNLRRQRLKKKLTQKVLGELSGLTETYINLLEGGKKNITLKNAKRIADALGCKRDDLLKGAWD